MTRLVVMEVEVCNECPFCIQGGVFYYCTHVNNGKQRLIIERTEEQCAIPDWCELQEAAF